MSIASRIENKGIFAISVFYVIAGIVFLILLPMSAFAPDLGLLGIVSLITAYGVLRKRSWSLWLVIVLFVAGTTFVAFTLYYNVLTAFLASLGLILYLILLLIATGYIAIRRRALES